MTTIVFMYLKEEEIMSTMLIKKTTEYPLTSSTLNLNVTKQIKKEKEGSHHCFGMLYTCKGSIVYFVRNEKRPTLSILVVKIKFIRHFTLI